MALQLLQHLQLDLLVTDFSLPDVQHTNILKDIRARFPDLPVLVLIMHDEAEIIREVLACGIKG